MAISLRTRVFLTVAVVLAASVIASSLLARRATLVEVRQVVTQLKEPLDLTSVASQVDEALRRGDLDAARHVLAGGERTLERPLILIDRDRRVVAASNEDLIRATVQHATESGDLSVRVTMQGGDTTLEVRGAPAIAVEGGDGRPNTLYALPSDKEGGPLLPGLRSAPVWMMTTASTAVIGLAVIFVLSRRVLQPVSALTTAVRRMEYGELDVRVDAPSGWADEIGELARSFNAMAARLAQTERLRRRMVSDVAHELRSPVTNLRCSLEAMQDGLMPLDRASINVLHDDTLLLQRLIADLQDLALAEAGRLPLHLSSVNVADVVSRALAASAPDSRPAIAVDIAPGLPALQADDDRLVQVLRNLLSNARRHTPADGSITIAARQADGSIRIEVRDTGQGIAPHHVPRVFERFYRADSSRSRSTGGAGLGLAIVRQLVLAHGGRVDVASDGPGRGTTFTIALPLECGRIPASAQKER